jgi:hypothetical protein
MSRLPTSCLLGLALILVACSDQNDQAAKGTSPNTPENKEPSVTAPQQDPFGSNNATPSKTPDALPKDQAEGMAEQLGIPSAEVEPLFVRVKQFRDEITGALRTASGQLAVEKTSGLIQQLSKAEHPGKLSEPMIQVVEAAAGDGAGQAIFRSGFLNLDATQIGPQMMLYSAVEEMARSRADLLASLVQQRSASSATSAADLIIYTAVAAGIQDNSDFQRTGSETTLSAVRPYAHELLKLSASPNPVYRLLAISLAQRLEPDAQKLEAFYAGFASEAEPYVKQAARRMVESASTPNAAELLRRFGAP